MVDKDEELQKFVKDKSIRYMLLSTTFPSEVFKEAKRKHFAVILENRLGGIPRDSDIAKAAMEYFFKTGKIQNKDDLDRILQLDFFSKNIFNYEYYAQKLGKVKGIDLDPRLLKNEEYMNSKKEELEKQIIEERGHDIDEEIRKKREEYESIKSKLESDYQLDQPEPQKIETTMKYNPWWKTLGLREDPFPSTNGIANIPDGDLERIIIKTEIYEKYVSYINNVPKDLFKNTIFYGQYGSGKTTFFQYLRKPLLRAHIYPIMITLQAEPDYQNFLMNFKKKLLRELIRIFEKLKDEDITERLQALSLDEQIMQAFKLIINTGLSNGFVIFIDDIYKPPAYENIGFIFLNHLQTFKTELTQNLELQDIGFFVSAPPEWRPIISENQEYSGSISLQEEMPYPGVEQARSMFNERLSAFSTDPKKYREVNLPFAMQIYHTLKSKGAWTFRQFIHECVNRFRDGNFDILTSNPVSISSNTLKSIRQLIQQHYKLNDGINEILKSNLSTRHKTESFELLIQIFKENGFDENSELYEKKISYLSALMNAGLIIKRRGNNGNATWVVSKELTDLDRIVFERYSYYLDDYFMRLYEGNLEIESREIQVLDQKNDILQILIDSVKEKRTNSLDGVQSLLEISHGIHKEIVSEMDQISDTTKFTKFSEKCLKSIRFLTEAVALYSGIPVDSSLGDPIEFWNDFRIYPDSLADFLKLARNPPRSLESDKDYLFAPYDTAVKDIVNFLKNQINRSNTYLLPSKGLTNNELNILDEAREHIIKNDLYKAAEEVSNLIEDKLREFLYSVFSLQYGGREQRIRRVPDWARLNIIRREEENKKQGFGVSKNEFTNLSRKEYCGIFVRDHYYRDIGEENWDRTFSKLFRGWNMVDIRSFLKEFEKYNLRGTHRVKDAFTAVIQGDLIQFIRGSIKFIVSINESYFLFLENAKKEQISSSAEMRYYFPLEKSTYYLQPVRLLDSNRQRLIDRFKGSKTNTIDVSSPSDIENKYGMDYEQVFAVLTDLFSQVTPALRLIANKAPRVTIKSN